MERRYGGGFGRGGGGGGYGGGYRQERSFAPVQVGEELDVRIEAVGEKGDGIAKKNGFVLFVPNTKEGDEVKIRITKVLRKVGFAEVVGQGKPAAKKVESGAGEEPAAEFSEESAEEESPKDSETFGEEDSSETPEPSEDIQEAGEEEEKQE